MKNFLIASILIISLASCVSVQRTVSQHNFSSVDEINKTTREGEACAIAVLGFFFGDMTVDKAAKEGGIKEVVFVENKFQNFPLYSKNCTIVKGK